MTPTIGLIVIGLSLLTVGGLLLGQYLRTRSNWSNSKTSTKVRYAKGTVPFPHLPEVLDLIQEGIEQVHGREIAQKTLRHAQINVYPKDGLLPYRFSKDPSLNGYYDPTEPYLAWASRPVIGVRQMNEDRIGGTGLVHELIEHVLPDLTNRGTNPGHSYQDLTDMGRELDLKIIEKGY